MSLRQMGQTSNLMICSRNSCTEIQANRFIATRRAPVPNNLLAQAFEICKKEDAHKYELCIDSLCVTFTRCIHRKNKMEHAISVYPTTLDVVTQAIQGLLKC